MRAHRLVLRLAALVPWTLLCFLLWLAGALPARARGHLAAWRARIQSLWSRGVCRIAGVRLSVEGPLPRGAFFLVANHLSYLDVVVLGALAPCAFVSKAEVARWPVLGFLARAMGTLFIERERKRALGRINELVAARLARGEALVLFPEGTSSGGPGVLPFRPALLEPAASLGVPVLFAALSYATPHGEPPARDAVCWWGDMLFVRHFLALLRLPYVETRVRFGREPLRAPDRKQLAQRLERAVLEHLQPCARHV